MKEALKLALEALEPDVYRAEWAVEQDREKAITAIKAALAQPTSGDYAHGYVEGFNDACMPKPAQPEQEPVAWATRMGEYAHIHWGAKRPEYPMVYEAPLYTTPPASVNEAPQEQQSCDRRTWGKPWVSLTDDEIWKFWCSRPEVSEGEDDSMEAEFVTSVRAVLAAHGIKEKNT